MADDELQNLPLGRTSVYADRYDASLLCGIPRASGRAPLGLDAAAVLPFSGDDVWNAYELSWLDAHGRPRVAVAQFVVPCNSPNIIESKSLKLYLNSLNMTSYPDPQRLAATLRADLSACAGAAVEVAVLDRSQWPATTAPEGVCIDDVPLTGTLVYQPDPDLLRCGPAATTVDETLCSHLLRSRCPVTSQPDWASLVIAYHGQAIDRAGLLAYLVSYRDHQGFHEQCIERIFMDLMARCKPESLSVTGYFLRRGGIDINPRRSHNRALPPWRRWTRQ